VRAEETGRRSASMSHMGSGSSEEPQPAERNAPRWDLWLYGTALVTAILVAATLLSPWVRHEWALSLGRQNTPYTQLGFTRSADLPVTAVRGKGIPVSFAVANDEGKQMSYQYVIASGSGTTLASLSSATNVVAAGATWNVNITVVPKCAASACRVQVSLPRQNEKIDFMFSYPKTSSAKKKTAPAKRAAK